LITRTKGVGSAIISQQRGRERMRDVISATLLQ
jgi:hypothetical protein